MNAVKTRARKVSNTNMVEKVPFAKKASAVGAKGAAGHAEAALIIRETEVRAAADVKVKAQLKNRLAELVPFSRDDHLEFRAELQKRVDQINAAAKAVSMNLFKYRAANAESNYIYVQLSEWKMFSAAIEAGWTPDFDKGWIALRDEARKAKKSEGKADPKLVEQLMEVRTDQTLSEEQKEELAAPLVQAINDAIVPKKVGPTQRTQQPEKSLWEQVFDLCKDKPLAEVDEIAGKLRAYVHEMRTANKIPATAPGKDSLLNPGTAPSDKPTAKASRKGTKAKAHAK